MRLLFERGYDRQDILELFRFIDWLVELPEDMEKQFQEELIEITEEKKMPYVTSIERLAMVRNSKEMLLDAVLTRFKSVPEDVADTVNSIKAVDILKALFREAILCQSLEDFRKSLLAAQDGQSQV